MAGFLPPLVRGSSRAGLAWIGAYVAAAAAGGASVGAASGFLGQLCRPFAGASFGPCFLVIAGLAVVWELGWLRRFLPERKRQVPVAWMANHGVCQAILLYGLSMGSGLVTYVSFGAFYVLLAWAFESGPVAGSLVMGFYGAAQTFPVVAAAVNLKRGLPPPITAANLSDPLLHRACAACAGWLFLVRFLMI